MMIVAGTAVAPVAIKIAPPSLALELDIIDPTKATTGIRKEYHPVARSGRERSQLKKPVQSFPKVKNATRKRLRNAPAEPRTPASIDQPLKG
jgi:hypothetical protein